MDKVQLSREAPINESAQLILNIQMLKIDYLYRAHSLFVARTADQPDQTRPQQGNFVHNSPPVLGIANEHGHIELTMYPTITTTLFSSQGLSACSLRTHHHHHHACPTCTTDYSRRCDGLVSIMLLLLLLLLRCGLVLNRRLGRCMRGFRKMEYR